MRPQVLAIGHDGIDYSQLREVITFNELVDVIYYTYRSKHQFLKDLEGFDNISGFWVASGGFISSEGGLAFDKEIIAQLPPNLKIITVSAIGYDKFDIGALKARGIKLANTPAVSANQVADIALSLTLSCFRFTPLLQDSLRTTQHTNKAKGLYQSNTLDWSNGKPKAKDPSEIKTFMRGDCLGGKPIESPHGKTVGIVGLGSIGIQVARRLDVIGMKISYTKRKRLTKDELLENGINFPAIYYPTFGELIPNCDLIVFCLPSTPQTLNLLNKETIQNCKNGVRIVNIGRGDVINEADLIESLQIGKIASAGLDVFQGEPHINKDLLSRWDVTCLPHIGSAAVEFRHLSAISCISNIKDILVDNGEGLTIVN